MVFRQLREFCYLFCQSSDVWSVHLKCLALISRFVYFVMVDISKGKDNMLNKTQRLILGLFILLLVDIIWVSSSELTKVSCTRFMVFTDLFQTYCTVFLLSLELLLISHVSFLRLSWGNVLNGLALTIICSDDNIDSEHCLILFNAIIIVFHVGH